VGRKDVSGDDCTRNIAIVVERSSSALVECICDLSLGDCSQSARFGLHMPNPFALPILTRHGLDANVSRCGCKSAGVTARPASELCKRAGDKQMSERRKRRPGDRERNSMKDKREADREPYTIQQSRFRVAARTQSYITRRSITPKPKQRGLRAFPPIGLAFVPRSRDLHSRRGRFGARAD